MPFVKTVDRPKAIFMRKIGLPYSEISKIVGCSHAWCAINLKDVELDYTLIDRLYRDKCFYVSEQGEAEYDTN